MEIGSQLINTLINKLCDQRRKEITLEVQESNLNAQLFYKSLGFKAERILKDNYLLEDGFEDGYFMKYSLNENDISLELSQRHLDWPYETA